MAKDEAKNPEEGEQKETQTPQTEEKAQAPEAGEEKTYSLEGKEYTGDQLLAIAEELVERAKNHKEEKAELENQLGEAEAALKEAGASGADTNKLKDKIEAEKQRANKKETQKKETEQLMRAMKQDFKAVTAKFAERWGIK